MIPVTLQNSRATVLTEKRRLADSHRITKLGPQHRKTSLQARLGQPPLPPFGTPVIVISDCPFQDSHPRLIRRSRRFPKVTDLEPVQLGASRQWNLPPRWKYWVIIAITARGDDTRSYVESLSGRESSRLLETSQNAVANAFSKS